MAGCKSLRRISQELGRSASTISREVARNGGPEKYRACHAEKAFLKRSRRPKLTLLSQDEELRGVVTKLLEADWSPVQIAGWLKRRSSDGKAMCVSHETIYKSLFIQTRGVLRQELKSTCAPRECFVTPSPIDSQAEETLSMRFPFESALHRWKTGPRLDIGKETCL